MMKPLPSKPLPGKSELRPGDCPVPSAWRPIFRGAAVGVDGFQFQAGTFSKGSERERSILGGRRREQIFHGAARDDRPLNIRVARFDQGPRPVLQYGVDAPQLRDPDLRIGHWLAVDVEENGGEGFGLGQAHFQIVRLDECSRWCREHRRRQPRSPRDETDLARAVCQRPGESTLVVSLQDFVSRPDRISRTADEERIGNGAAVRIENHALQFTRSRPFAGRKQGLRGGRLLCVVVLRQGRVASDAKAADAQGDGEREGDEEQ